MKQVVLFGNGPVAAMAHYYLTHDSLYKVAAITVDRAFMTGDEALGLPVVAFEDIQRRYPPAEYDMYVAIGYRRMNKLREEKYRQAKELGYRLITYVSSKATTWPTSTIGDNCFIMENVTIHPFVEIGNDITIWSDTLIGHGSVVKDHCFISGRTAIAGNVTIEPNCFFGMNSTIRDEVTIARECVIGAGAVILKDTQERGVYMAAGARLLPVPSDRLPKL